MEMPVLKKGFKCSKASRLLEIALVNPNDSKAVLKDLTSL